MDASAASSLNLAADVGARKDGKAAPLQVGHPRDLLVCRETMQNSESSESEAQRLNLLSNTLPSKSFGMPSGWRHVEAFPY
jgi:hypothetical protein